VFTYIIVKITFPYVTTIYLVDIGRYTRAYHLSFSFPVKFHCDSWLTIYFSFIRIEDAETLLCSKLQLWISWAS